MIPRQIHDWDDAYANGVNIPGGDRWPAAWIEPARLWRETLLAKGRARLDIAYSDGPRNRVDLFLPEAQPKGLVVFVHGGYWRSLDKSYWSHLARGPIEAGFAVAMPAYSLCPDVRVRDITAQIGIAIEKAATMVQGLINLAGHSAGGHLAARMICADAPLSAATRARIRNVVSISGVHDLRPIMKTAINNDLRVGAAEARAESPALLEPAPGARLTCWVGAAERAEFIRQNALLANIWAGLGARTSAVEEPDRHHFTVIDGLADRDHPLVAALLS